MFLLLCHSPYLPNILGEVIVTVSEGLAIVSLPMLLAAKTKIANRNADSDRNPSPASLWPRHCLPLLTSLSLIAYRLLKLYSGAQSCGAFRKYMAPYHHGSDLHPFQRLRPFSVCPACPCRKGLAHPTSPDCLKSTSTTNRALG